MGLKALANSGYTIAVEVMMVGVCVWGGGWGVGGWSKPRQENLRIEGWTSMTVSCFPTGPQLADPKPETPCCLPPKSSIALT